jgi:hypothetical protein
MRHSEDRNYPSPDPPVRGRQRPLIPYLIFNQGYGWPFSSLPYSAFYLLTDLISLIRHDYGIMGDMTTVKLKFLEKTDKVC